MKKYALILGLSFLLIFTFLPLPDPLFQDDFSKILLDREGRLLDCGVAKDQQWRFRTSGKIPADLLEASLLFEDEYFYWHPGINPISLIRAFRHNWKAGHIVSGGSTITMQLVRMSQGNPTRTYWHKTWECLLALKLDLLYSKREILELYFENAPYGGNLVGVRSAAFRYFGRDLEQLSSAEYALLAILPNNPGFLFPGNNKDLLLLKKRNTLIRKWARKKHWTAEDEELACAEPLPNRLIEFPHFAFHAMHSPQVHGEKTSLDLNLQIRIRKLVEDHLTLLKGNQIHNAAVLVADISTGQVRAYIGNGDPAEPGENRFVDMVQALRSPGSTLKPILYANAIARRMILPEEILPDHPVHLKGFAPKNFNRSYQGAIPADQALASSLNIPFVHLLQKYGYEQFHADLNQGGFVLRESPDHYGLSIILGGIEVNMWQLTSAYRHMAHNYYQLIEAPVGKLHMELATPSISLGDPIIAESWTEEGWFHPWAIGSMLQAMMRLRRPEDMAHWERFESSSTIAWKTGTSYGFRDAWAVGIGGRHVASVWLGNADGTGRPNLIGSKVAGPLMFDLMALLDEPSCMIADIGDRMVTCKQTGIKAGPLCRETKIIHMPADWHDQKICSYHTIRHTSTDDKYRVFPNCYTDPIRSDTLLNLPPAMSRYIPTARIHEMEIPWHPDCQSRAQEQMLQLIYPVGGSYIQLVRDQSGKTGQVVFHAIHGDGARTVYWYIGENFLGQTTGIHKLAVTLGAGNYELTLIDDQGVMLSEEFNITN